jgi:hypothetical protein
VSRRRNAAAAVAALAVAALAVGACSDDGDGGAAALADDPTTEDCLAATETVLGRLEIPSDFDPADGVDDDERAAAEAAFEDAAAGLFDPNDDDHPCNAALDGATPEQIEEFMADVDPEVIAFLGAMAEVRFDEIEVETEPED